MLRRKIKGDYEEKTAKGLASKYVSRWLCLSVGSHWCGPGHMGQLFPREALSAVFIIATAMGWFALGWAMTCQQLTNQFVWPVSGGVTIAIWAVGSVIIGLAVVAITASIRALGPIADGEASGK